MATTYSISSLLPGALNPAVAQAARDMSVSATAIADAADVFSSFLGDDMKKTQDDIKKATDSVQEASGAFKIMTDTITETVKRLTRSLFGEAGQDQEKHWLNPDRILNLLFDAIHLTGVTDLKGLMLILVEVLHHLGMLTSSISTIMRAVRDWYRGIDYDPLHPTSSKEVRDEPQTQSGIGGLVGLSLESLLTFASVATSAVVFGTSPSLAKVQGMIGVMGNFCRSVHNIKLGSTSFWEMGTKLCDILRYCMKWVLYKWNPERALTDGNITANDIVAWHQMVLDMTAPSAIEGVCNSEALQNTIYKLVDQKLTFLEAFKTCKKPAPALFQDTCNRLTALHNVIKTIKNVHIVRDDPFSLQLVGAPGVGKSKLTPFLADWIREKEGYAKVNACYSRASVSSTDAYWNGYYGQPIVILDDFGQNIDPSCPVTAEFILMKSALPFQIPQADISDKGRYFAAKYLISTTNSPYPVFAHLVDAQAIWRRRDVLIETRIKPQTSIPDNPLDMSHIQFRFMNPIQSNNYLSDWMSLTDMLSELNSKIDSYWRTRAAYNTQLRAQGWQAVVDASTQSLSSDPTVSLTQYVDPMSVTAAMVTRGERESAEEHLNRFATISGVYYPYNLFYWDGKLDYELYAERAAEAFELCLVRAQEAIRNGAAHLHVDSPQAYRRVLQNRMISRRRTDEATTHCGQTLPTWAIDGFWSEKQHQEWWKEHVDKTYGAMFTAPAPSALLRIHDKEVQDFFCLYFDAIWVYFVPVFIAGKWILTHRPKLRCEFADDIDYRSREFTAWWINNKWERITPGIQAAIITQATWLFGHPEDDAVLMTEELDWPRLQAQFSWSKNLPPLCTLDEDTCLQYERIKRWYKERRDKPRDLFHIDWSFTSLHAYDRHTRYKTAIYEQYKNDYEAMRIANLDYPVAQAGSDDTIPKELFRLQGMMTLDFWVEANAFAFNFNTGVSITPKDWETVNIFNSAPLQQQQMWLATCTQLQLDYDAKKNEKELKAMDWIVSKFAFIQWVKKHQKQAVVLTLAGAMSVFGAYMLYKRFFGQKEEPTQPQAMIPSGDQVTRRQPRTHVRQPVQYTRQQAGPTTFDRTQSSVPIATTQGMIANPDSGLPQEYALPIGTGDTAEAWNDMKKDSIYPALGQASINLALSGLTTYGLIRAMPEAVSSSLLGKMACVASGHAIASTIIKGCNRDEEDYGQANHHAFHPIQGIQQTMTPGWFRDALVSTPVAEGMVDDIMTLLRKNQVYCRNAAGEGVIGTFVTGRQLLIPLHFVNSTLGKMYSTPRDLFFYIIRNDTQVAINYDPANLSLFKGKDMAVYKCPTSINSYTDIIKHFICDGDMEPGVNHEAVLCGLSNNVIPSYQQIIAEPRASIKYSDPNKTVEYVLLNGLGYGCISNPGDCGSMVVLTSRTRQRRFAAMHVVGYTLSHRGAAECITQEDLMPLRSEHNITPHQHWSYDPPLTHSGAPTTDPFFPGGDVDYLPPVPPRQRIRQPDRTDIVPSRIFDQVYPHVTEPAPISANDPRVQPGISPLKKALKKFSEGTLPFHPNHIKIATEQLTTQLLMCEDGTMPIRLLSDDEVVNGNPLYPYWDRMNMETSPGIPFVHSRPAGAKGKAYLFSEPDEDGNRTIASKELETAYKTRLSELKEGKVGKTVFADVQKDERIKNEKVDAGKVRLFNMAPVDFTMATRKYFLAFCAFYYQHHLAHDGAPGINPESYEWTIMRDKLASNSCYALAGDYSCFDGKLDPELMGECCEIINTWYDDGDENARARRAIFEDLIHSYHQVGTTMYRKHRGNPSGCALTVILNSMVNSLYLRVAYLSLQERAYEQGLIHEILPFETNVVVFVYGDDMIATVRKRVLSWYNQQTLQWHFANHNIKFTTATKEDAKDPCIPLDLATFLKRRLKPSEALPGVYVPGMDCDTIQDLTNWIRKCDNPTEALLTNLGAAQRFAYFWGKTFFDSFTRAVNHVLRRERIGRCPFSYQQLESEFLLGLGRPSHTTCPPIPDEFILYGE